MIRVTQKSKKNTFAGSDQNAGFVRRDDFLVLLALVLLTNINAVFAQELPSFPKMYDEKRFDRFLDLTFGEKKHKPRDNSDTTYDADDGTSSRNGFSFGDRFDGSEYGASKFMDSDFGRQSYRDNFTTLPYTGAAMYKNRVDTALIDLKKDRLDPDDDRRARLWKELTSTPPGMLQDWVPSKPDPTASGSFGLGADNGAPVPYTLNGFPDLQRGLPSPKGN